MMVRWRYNLERAGTNTRNITASGDVRGNGANSRNFRDISLIGNIFYVLVSGISGRIVPKDTNFLIKNGEKIVEIEWEFYPI